MLLGRRKISFLSVTRLLPILFHSLASSNSPPFTHLFLLTFSYSPSNIPLLVPKSPRFFLEIYFGKKRDKFRGIISPMARRREQKSEMKKGTNEMEDRGNEAGNGSDRNEPSPGYFQDPMVTSNRGVILRRNLRKDSTSRSILGGNSPIVNVGGSKARAASEKRAASSMERTNTSTTSNTTNTTSNTARANTNTARTTTRSTTRTRTTRHQENLNFGFWDLPLVLMNVFESRLEERETDERRSIHRISARNPRRDVNFSLRRRTTSGYDSHSVNDNSGLYSVNDNSSLYSFPDNNSSHSYSNPYSHNSSHSHNSPYSYNSPYSSTRRLEEGLEFIIAIPTIIIQLNLKAFFKKRGKVLKRKLKKTKLFSFMKGMEEQDCPICMSAFEEKQSIRRLKCKHEFHMDCVDKWVCSGQDNCPVCRSTDIFGE